MFLPHPRVKVSIVGSLRDREVACSASDRQGSIFESCVWRTVSSQSAHHHQEVLLAQFSLYVHKGGLKPDSFFISFLESRAHLKGSVLALTLVAGRLCPGSLSPGLLANACTITYLTRWKERGTIRFIPELVHNLASALALRAPLASGVDNKVTDVRQPRKLKELSMWQMCHYQ